MTSPEKLKALLDLVYFNTFSKSTTVDVDGNIKVTYATSPVNPLPFQGFSPSTPTAEKLIEAMENSLVGPVEIYESGKTYRRFSVVRYGLSDYLSITETSSIPTGVNWVKIRQNQKGATGDDGSDSQTFISNYMNGNGSQGGDEMSNDSGGFNPENGGGPMVFDPETGTWVPA
jgi:hypothetical protein